jgi:hypothetical protein
MSKPFVAVDSAHPLYCRPKQARVDDEIESDGVHIDLSHVHMEPFGDSNSVSEANRLFDKRAAAAVSTATQAKDFLEKQDFDGKAPTINIATVKCLAALAFPDFFPNNSAADGLRVQVTQAIMAASPGWCGSFGPGVDGTIDVADIFSKHEEGNYDMSQMHLLQIAYRYYDFLVPEAREHLVQDLLARGRIRRPNKEDIFTSGAAPDDWMRAGFLEVPLPVIGDLLGIHVKVKRIGETENHILTIHTARYLTNQLLYQRDHHPSHDNRRNGDGNLSCTELMLLLLRNILRDDFSEYNAKSYQQETRSALLNLCSYAYDHEVRLAAHMVLDYISAHIAVSSNDLRRMVPFRRRNEKEFGDGKHGRSVQLEDGAMDVGLLDWFLGADPMPVPFAMQAGNTRAHEIANVTFIPPEFKFQARPWLWAIASDGGDAVVEVLSDYRLPPSIHDLFVNDLHRRFFQRLHRVSQDDPEVTGRNCDNMEIYASSPSYLITAGGSPADYAIDPRFLGKVVGDQEQQLGVAVTTSFMPTTRPNLDCGNPSQASDLIQFSNFSDQPGTLFNYGVAPDFACGHSVHLPEWCREAINPNESRGKFAFVDRGGAAGRPGFYLALMRDGNFTVMEAFDTWLHPELTFTQFMDSVWERNQLLSDSGLKDNTEAIYTTQNGNRIHFRIWLFSPDSAAPGFVPQSTGASIVSIDYGAGDPLDSVGDAGNVTDHFLNGTIMNSKEDGVIEITNHFLNTTIRLDMSDQAHPRRTSETGEVEEAGNHHEVWVDFTWQGPQEGDFFHPFNTLAGADAAVASGGVIKIMPGSTSERPILHQRARLVAPIGGVQFGAH